MASLPVQTAFERATLHVQKPFVSGAADGQPTVLCGVLSGAAVRGALSATQGAKALALPSDAQLAKFAAPDADTDGDGQADGWRFAVLLETAAATAIGWTP